MILADLCSSIETLLEVRPMTRGEGIYWRGWIRTLVSLGGAMLRIEPNEPATVARFEQLSAAVIAATANLGELPIEHPGCAYHRVLVHGCAACDAKVMAGTPLADRPPGVLERRVLADAALGANWLFVEKRADGSETVIDSGVAWVAGSAPPDYPPWREG